MVEKYVQRGWMQAGLKLQQWWHNSRWLPDVPGAIGLSWLLRNKLVFSVVLDETSGSSHRKLKRIIHSLDVLLGPVLLFSLQGVDIWYYMILYDTICTCVCTRFADCSSRQVQMKLHVSFLLLIGAYCMYLCNIHDSTNIYLHNIVCI